MTSVHVHEADERFRTRALIVLSVGLVGFLLSAGIQRVTSEALRGASWIPLLIVITTNFAAQAAVYFRWHGLWFARLALYSSSAIVVMFVAQYGGLSGYHGPALAVMPALCALVFDSRDITFYSFCLLAAVVCLYVYDDVLPSYVVEPAALLTAAASVLGAVLVVNMGVLVLLMRESESRLRRLKDLLAKEKHAATHDELTQLSNRAGTKAFFDALDISTDRYQVFMIDLDGFKHVNDSCGHGAGDDVLVAVARRLRQIAPGAALLARLGGDEFLVVEKLQQDSFSETSDKTHMGDSLVQGLRMRFNFAGIDCEISGSIGSARMPEDALTATEAFAKSDAALYRAKDTGKSCHVTYVEAAQYLPDTD